MTESMDTDPTNTAVTIAARYWAAIEARDWDAFAELLADDVVYEMPQTRERIRGRAAYVQFNREYPGDWHVTVQRLTGSGAHAATWTSFNVDGQTETGLAFLDLDDHGRIALVTDFWPEPYDPPAGRAHLVERW
jgi:ketosteroid isomerase-like protein